MTREIKFRAWDKIEKKWFDNVLPLSDGMFLVEDINAENGVAKIPDFINERAPNEFAIVEYTGVKADNGNEIYEGDVVKGTTIEDTGTGTEEVSWIATIKYDEKDLKWVADCFEEQFELGDYSPLGKVIGNIYENPELLK